ncbi:MAG: ribosome maturation factor RimP [Actinomycetia bacterium]|nr:ribosome maturation factor RimP [Actinomycetes bacterium]
MTSDTAARLTAILEPLATDHGLELVAVEIVGQPGSRVVRVYLDREGGIDIETIARANAWISDALDDADVVTSGYTLEVSSPGIERPLRKASDWVRFSGRTAVVKTTHPIEGRSTFTGVIGGLEGDTAVIDIEDATFRIPVDAIRKAHLKIDFDTIEEGKTR